MAVRRALTPGFNCTAVRNDIAKFFKRFKCGMETHGVCELLSADN